MALVVLLGEIVFASLNNYAYPFYILDDLGRPARVVGILISSFLIAEMLLKLPFGHLSDRYGRRRFAAIGLAACVLTPLVVCAIPTSVFIAAPALLFALLPLRLLDGAGAAALWPPLFAAVPDHVPSRQRGVAMSVMNIAYLAGLALGPTLAGTAMTVSQAVAGPGPWVGKAPFAVAAVLAAVGALVAAGLPAGAGPSHAPADRSPSSLPATGMIAVIVVITFGEMFATGTLAPYLAPYVREVAGIDRSHVGFLLLLLFMPAGLLGIPVGHLTDRWPKHRIVQVALWMAAAGLWAVPLARSTGPMLAAGVLVVLGFLLGLPAWLALITDLAPAGKIGRMLGITSTAQGLGACLGPVVGGHLWDMNIRYPFYAGAALLTLSAAVALIFIGRLKAGTSHAVGESHLSGG
jgi:DHA1 family multidrug resistance protein-like MFS transporter